MLVREAVKAYVCPQKIYVWFEGSKPKLRKNQASPLPDKQLVKIEFLSCTLQKEHARGNISPAFASPVFIHDGDRPDRTGVPSHARNVWTRFGR